MVTLTRLTSMIDACFGVLCIIMSKYYTSWLCDASREARKTGSGLQPDLWHIDAVQLAQMTVLSKDCGHSTSKANTVRSDR